MKFKIKTLQDIVNEKNFESIQKEAKVEENEGFDCIDVVKNPWARKRSDILIAIVFLILVVCYFIFSQIKLHYAIGAISIGALLIYSVLSDFTFKITYDSVGITVTRGLWHTSSYKYEQLGTLLENKERYLLTVHNAKSISIPKYCIGLDRFIEMIKAKVKPL